MTGRDDNLRKRELEERLRFIDQQFLLTASLICDAEMTYDHIWANSLNNMADRLTESLGTYMETHPVNLNMMGR